MSFSIKTKHTGKKRIQSSKLKQETFNLIELWPIDGIRLFLFFIIVVFLRLVSFCLFNLVVIVIDDD